MPSRLSDDSFPVPDSLPQSPECADPAVDFGVDIGAVEENAAQVGKVLYCQEVLSIHLDLLLVVSVFGNLLIHQLGSLEYDSKAKIVTVRRESIQLELHFVLTTGDAGTVETH